MARSASSFICDYQSGHAGVTLADLQAAWRGRPGGALAAHPLLASAGTQRVLAALWGEPGATSVRTVDEQQLLAEAERTSAWAIVPFDALEMRWKVLQVDGLWPLARGLDQGYPLQVRLTLTGRRVQDVLPLVAGNPALTNRQEWRMTTVAMTGVTALVRATAKVMEAYGVTYPAKDIKG
jgi:poly-gamma-glutamate synthesis protein (capsule biosynthesis protein)